MKGSSRVGDITTHTRRSQRSLAARTRCTCVPKYVRWGNRSPAALPARLATDHQWTERIMRKVVGLDISLQKTAVCMLDHDGRLVWQGKVDSEPGALIEKLRLWHDQIDVV